MSTENFNDMELFKSDLFDAVTLKTERAVCVLELIASAGLESQHLPALILAINEIKSIDTMIDNWESINA